MTIVVSAQGFRPTGALRRKVRRSLLFALSRFGARVESVTVRLAEVVNPLGGVDTRYRMCADLGQWGTVGVEVLDGSAAIGRATTRLRARVERALLDGAGDEVVSRIPAAWRRGPGARRS